MKNVLVTGSTDGIGKRTALELAAKGYTVLIHGRNKGKVENTLQELKDQTGNSGLTAMTADFASLNEVKALAQKITDSTEKLDILLNNAGIMQKSRTLSKDGHELTFAVNHLAPFLLTHLVLEHMKKAEIGRIITVSSQIHADSIDFSDLMSEKSYSGSKAYSLSKLCNILFTYALARRLKGTTMTANCLHPGVINTKLLRESWGAIGSPVAKGAETTVYLATSPDVESVTGAYFKDKKQKKSARITYDQEVQERLWERSLELVKEFV